MALRPPVRPLRPRRRPRGPRGVLDPTNPDDTFAAEDGDGTLVGFFEFTPREEAVETGLGIRPECTGRGLGRAFVEAGLGFASERHGVDRFEPAVAAFNERAIAVYEGVGFERVGRWAGTSGGEHGFVRM